MVDKIIGEISRVKTVRTEKPILFGLPHDNIPSVEEISEFEKRYHIQLPEKYKQFLLEYGGGYFGYANIYSLEIRDTEFSDILEYLVKVG